MLLHLFILLFVAVFGVQAATVPGPNQAEIPDYLEPGLSILDQAEEFVKITKVLGAVNANDCPLDKAKLPLDRTSPPLPNPGNNYKLKYVALGRGTQNYTCNPANATAAPVAVGAVATLYDASCLLHRSPDLLHTIPPPFSGFLPNTINFISAVFSRLLHSTTDTLVLGQHYFNGNTPFFDFRLGGKPDWVGTKKVASADAPTKGNDVPWLKLESTGSNGIKVSSVPPHSP